MKYQFSICRTIATCCVIAILILTIFSGGNISVFVRTPSLAVTFGLCFFILLAVYKIEFLKFIPHALRIFFCKPPEPNPRFSQITLFGSRSVIGAGLIGMLIRFIQMLSNLSNPSGLGIGMATAFICPFHTIIASEIFFSIVHQSFKITRSKKEDDTTLPFDQRRLTTSSYTFFTKPVFSFDSEPLHVALY